MTDETEDDLPPGLGKPALRALGAAGYTRLGQLAAVTEADLRRLHGVGPKAIGLIRDALSARGLSFAEPRQTCKIGRFKGHARNMMLPAFHNRTDTIRATMGTLVTLC